MSLAHHNFSQVWAQLRAKKPQLKQFLESVRVCNLRMNRNTPKTFA